MAFLQPRSGVYVTEPAVHLPAREMTNERVIAWMGASIRPEWITRRTGIETRYWVEREEAVSDIGVKAAEALLLQWPGERESIRQVILATISGDYPTPPSAPILQDRLGLTRAGCFDLAASCAGFTTGLFTAAGLCDATGEVQLLVSADIRSKFLNPRDPATAVLFGDGAAACLVSRNAGSAAFGVVAGELLTDGSAAGLVCQEAGGSRLPSHWPREDHQAYVRMTNGPRVFMAASEGMRTAAQSLLDRLGMTIEEVDWVVPHQANLHLVRDLARLVGCPPVKVVETVREYGNTSGSSVGLALNRLCRNRELKTGHNVLLVSAGGGGVAATALLRRL
jgi:3-oxoacyl-[acyl-carrier-protein] synthase III